MSILPEEMVSRVREAASKGMCVTWSRGTDAQICGEFLDVRVSLRKGDIHSQYLGWCSLRAEPELKRIVEESRPKWADSLIRTKSESELPTQIALLLQKCSLLEADQKLMEPQFAVNKIAEIRGDLETLYEAALVERG